MSGTPSEDAPYADRTAGSGATVGVDESEMTFTTPRSPAIRLFLTAMSILFVELLLDPLDPGQVSFIGFFSNFLLMASFLGIGLGILLGTRSATRSASRPSGRCCSRSSFLSLRSSLDFQLDSPDELFFGARRVPAAAPT